MRNKSAHLRLENNRLPPGPPRRPVIVRSEGQRLLLAVEDSPAKVAEACKCTPHAVRFWRLGDNDPSGPMRAILAAAYSIPLDSWDKPPLETGASHYAGVVRRKMPNAGKPPGGPRGALSTLEEVHALIAATKAEAGEESLRAGERVKLNDTLAKLLALRSRLEQAAELSEDRFVHEHPAWIRIRRTVIATLTKFPEAARAVEKALAELEGKP